MGRYSPPGALSVADIVSATGGRLARPGEGTWSFCTDTRELEDGMVFVALRGEVHDGHRFVRDALESGRVGAIVDARSLEEGLDLPERTAGPVIVVDDTLVAFGDVARRFLAQHPVPVAAVTGSVGKTTTRSMLASILRQRGPGLESEGNFNNRIGVPLTALRLQPTDTWAVLEMGMSEPGEIAELARIARPRVRIITEVAAAHLEFFDGVEQIADAKGEMFGDAGDGDVLIYPLDNPLHARFPMPDGAERRSFSLAGSPDAAARVTALEDRGPAGSRATFALPGADGLEVDVPLPGAHQVHNALAAAAAGLAMGATPGEVAAGLAAVEVPGRRMKVGEVAGVTVLDDAYNANPASVAAALRTLAAFPCRGRRVAAVGDMLELGATGPELHAAVGAQATDLGLDLLVATGPLMTHAAEAAGISAVAVPDAAAAGAHLRGWLRPGDVLLLKGSRGMRMEGVLDALSEES